MYFIGFLGYVILADGNVQSWAVAPIKDEEKNEMELKNDTQTDNLAFEE